MDKKKIKKAKMLAKKLYKDQKRLSGESYYNHVKSVYNLLVDAGVKNDEILIASLLHHGDLEQFGNTVEKEFGAEALSILKKLKKLSQTKINIESPREYNERYILQTFLNLAQDIRVLIVRLAEKTIDIKTALVLPKDERIKAAEKALFVYAPICRTVGLGKLVKTLEDGAFKILNPEKYHEIEKMLERKTPKLKKLEADMRPVVTELLEEAGIKANITCRIKNIYGIHRKFIYAQTEKLSVRVEKYEDVYDLAATRIFVDTIEECYKTEDILKQLWEYIPEARDDYIRNPKPNGYKSIHNIFKVEKDQLLEVQIRTKDMHEENEYGVASHALYKGGKIEREFIEKLEENPLWLKELNYWNIENQGQYIKEHHFGKYVYVITPKGDIIKLPRGSTPIDFAYEIHSDLGNKCDAALVNRQIVKLNYLLNDGDTVEIITNNSKKGPSRNWLKIAKSKKARTAIRKALS